MDVIKQLNNAIVYIEENLCDEIDINRIAEIAFCPYDKFKRFFSYMTNMSVSEYIRKGDTLEFLLNEITEIEKYIFEINIEKQGKEIRKIEKFFVMKQIFDDYINEYIQFINGNHKGDYSNICLPTKEELQRSKLALQKEYNKLKHKNTLNFIGI